jgi:hypothetical protein
VSEERSKLLPAATTVPSTTVNYGLDKISSSLFTLIKSEFKAMWSKVALFNDTTEVVIGGVVSICLK